MISERTILIADDGSGYSDQVTIVYEDANGLNALYLCNADSMYSIVHAALQKMATMGVRDTSEQGAKRQGLAKLVRVAIKGMLIMYGNQILDELFATKDHPRPQKGDDLLDWYTDMFTKIGISYLMKNDTVLQGKTIRHDDETRVVAVDTVFTRPVAAPETHENTSGTDA
jgi:hypothetical protein